MNSCYKKKSKKKLQNKLLLKKTVDRFLYDGYIMSIKKRNTKEKENTMKKAAITLNKKVTIITENENGCGKIRTIDYKTFNSFDLNFDEIIVKISLNKNTNSKLQKIINKGYIVIDEMKGWGFDDIEIFRKLKRVA